MRARRRASSSFKEDRLFEAHAETTKEVIGHTSQKHSQAIRTQIAAALSIDNSNYRNPNCRKIFTSP